MKSRRDQRGPVGEDDGGDGKRGNQFGDALFCVGIDVGCALVQQ